MERPSDRPSTADRPFEAARHSRQSRAAGRSRGLAAPRDAPCRPEAAGAAADPCVRLWEEEAAALRRLGRAEAPGRSGASRRRPEGAEEAADRRALACRSEEAACTLL